VFANSVVVVDKVVVPLSLGTITVGIADLARTKALLDYHLD
jgi:hypothetical protein